MHRKNAIANRLALEHSPYLLQHAYNPVDWYPWGEEALRKAEKENKLILVSVGYSACHWCHVMEKESFEDPSVADIMNAFFVCIKIDREERPDIDQIYMDAVQLMTGRGGWPLNCFCLPNQQPIYGGTYFAKTDWKNVLLSLVEFWSHHPEEAQQYGKELTAGIHQLALVKPSSEPASASRDDLLEIVKPWKFKFDLVEGGTKGAPKFPMPNNWQFMLRYAALMKDEEAFKATKITLQKMAFGGIYDHIGGGFSRYAVDDHWHVPHFEKMLYDNAQLLSLYAEAYQCVKDQLYKEVVYQTIGWLEREMRSPDGGFYAALDADSEGVEGKFYVFSKVELEEALGADAELFNTYYGVTSYGNWEEEHTNVLIRKHDDKVLAHDLGIELEVLHERMQKLTQQVATYRERRARPGLDHKIIASWNGLTLKGLADAYRVFGEERFFHLAKKNACFILDHLKSSDYSLKRTYAGDGVKARMAFLDDYGFVISGLIALYEVSFNEIWLTEAKRFMDFVIENFYDGDTGFFYYTSVKGEALITRRHELMDNVMPSSNSIMAENLYKLGYLYDTSDYLNKAQKMLHHIKPRMKGYGPAYSNWASLLLNEAFGWKQIALVGEDFSAKRVELERHYIPNKILMGGQRSSLPLLKDKMPDKGTKLYLCEGNTCRLPVTEVNHLISQLT